MIGMDESKKNVVEPPLDVISTQQPWNRTRLMKGMRVFVALTMLVVFILMVRGDLHQNLGVFRSIGLFAIFIGLLQSILDLCGGGVRLWLVARAFGARVGLPAFIRANGAGILVGGLTPSQTGGGPAQIYILARSGVGLPVALVSSFLAYMCTILVLLGFGLLMLWHGPPRAIGEGTATFLRFGATFLGSFLLLFLLAMPRPGIYHSALVRLSRHVPWLKTRMGASGVLARVGYTLDTSSKLLRQIPARGILWLVGGVVMTLMVYCNKFLVAYFLLCAMGIEANPLEVIFLQWVLYLVLYFAPTPGASGLAELSAVAIMADVLPPVHSAVFVILWRVFSLYVPMALSGVLFLRFSSKAKEKQPELRHAAERGVACHSLTGGV